MQATKKSALRSIAVATLEEAYAIEDALSAEVFSTEDAKEGTYSFFEKRPQCGEGSEHVRHEDKRPQFALIDTPCHTPTRVNSYHKQQSPITLLLFDALMIEDNNQKHDIGEETSHRFLIPNYKK